MNAHLLLALAIWLLPPCRKDWGYAMKGEFDSASRNRTEFAFGCLTGSLKENLTTGQGVVRIALWTFAALIGHNTIWHLWHLSPEIFADLGGVSYLAYFANGLAAKLLPILFWAAVGWQIVSASIKSISLNSIAAVAWRWMALLVMLQVGHILQVQLAANVFRYTPNDGTHWTGILPTIPLIFLGIMVAVWGWRSAIRLSIGSLVGAAFIYVSGFESAAYTTWDTVTLKQIGTVTYLAPSFLLIIGFMALAIHCAQQWAEKKPMFKLRAKP